MQIHIGTKIKELRRRDGRTQEDLAMALGITTQAVSRWESATSYPDLEFIPSIAHFFGVSIDSLFGYNNERAKKLEALVRQLEEMNRQNNGVDVNMDECIRIAKEGLAEFPENERLMCVVADVFFNAGYVRYGERHLTDEDGYDVYDAERHKTYAEWQDAIRLYEKLLLITSGDTRHKVVQKLAQLYLNTGEKKKATSLAEHAPDLSGTKTMMRLYAVDGKERAVMYKKIISELTNTLSLMMIHDVMAMKNHLTAEEAAEQVKNAMSLFTLIHPNGDFGDDHAPLCEMSLYLSFHLFRAGKNDAAYAALDEALIYAQAFDPSGKKAKELPEIWPCWCIPSHTEIKENLEKAPRFIAWIEKTKA